MTAEITRLRSCAAFALVQKASMRPRSNDRGNWACAGLFVKMCHLSFNEAAI